MRAFVHPIRTATRTRLAWALVAATVVTGAQAADFTLQGHLLSDDEVRLFALTVADDGIVGVTSFGYGGGQTSAGQVIGRGGFDTMLYLFDAAGTLVAQSDDGIGALVDPTTGQGADAGFSLSLTAGHYTLALTQYDNVPLGDLSAGFSAAGLGNFTPGLSGTCAASAFCDWTGAARTAGFSLEVTGVSAVPEVSTLGMAVAGLALLAGIAGRRQRATA